MCHQYVLCTMLLSCPLCFSLTFQSQAQPLSSLKPLATFNLLSILHPRPSLHNREWYSPSESGKQNARTAEKERGGGKQSCIKLFFKWWRSERRSRPKRGWTNRSVWGPREAGSQLSWPPHSLLLLAGGALSFVNRRLSAIHGWPLLACSLSSSHDSCHHYVCQNLSCLFRP